MPDLTPDYDDAYTTRSVADIAHACLVSQVRSNARRTNDTTLSVRAWVWLALTGLFVVACTSFDWDAGAFGAGIVIYVIAFLRACYLSRCRMPVR